MPRSGCRRRVSLAARASLAPGEAVHLSEPEASPVADVGVLIAGQRGEGLDHSVSAGGVVLDAEGQTLGNSEPDLCTCVVDADVVQEELGSLRVPGLTEGGHGLSHDAGVGLACQDPRKSGKGVRNVLVGLPFECSPEFTHQRDEVWVVRGHLLIMQHPQPDSARSRRTAFSGFRRRESPAHSS